MVRQAPRRPPDDDPAVDVAVLLERVARLDDRVQQAELKFTDFALLLERMTLLDKRVAEAEKRISEFTTLLNRLAGIIAAILAFGVFIGWLVAIGGDILKWMRH